MGELYTGYNILKTETGEEDEAKMKRRFKEASTVVSMQHMLSKLSTQCFRKCVARPQESLNGSEERCIIMCMDRYVDSFNLVARAYGNRLQHELKKSRNHDHDHNHDDD